jgi:hypothetical protein
MYKIQNRRNRGFLSDSDITRWLEEDDPNVRLFNSRMEAAALAEKKNGRVVIHTTLECRQCLSQNVQHVKRSQFTWPRKSKEYWGFECPDCGDTWGFPWMKVDRKLYI